MGCLGNLLGIHGDLMGSLYIYNTNNNNVTFYSNLCIKPAGWLKGLPVIDYDDPLYTYVGRIIPELIINRGFENYSFGGQEFFDPMVLFN